MTKQVQIIKKSSYGIVSEYAIDLPNPHAIDEDYANPAWECAVNDSIADLDCRSDFEFSISDLRISRLK